MSEKTHFKKAFNTPYLGSQDLPGYKDMNATIERVILQGSEGLKENSNFNIAYFKDTNLKPMLLNATNSKRLAKLAGSPYIEDWLNIEVTLTVQKVRAFGDIHDALRIREVTRKNPVSLPVLNKKHKKWLEIISKVKGGTKRDVISKYYVVSDEVWQEILDLIEQQAQELKTSKEAERKAKEKEAADAKKSQEDATDEFLNEKE